MRKEPATKHERLKGAMARDGARGQMHRVSRLLEAALRVKRIGLWYTNIFANCQRARRKVQGEKSQESILNAIKTELEGGGNTYSPNAHPSRRMRSIPVKNKPKTKKIGGELREEL